MDTDAEAMKLVMKSMNDAALRARRSKYAPKPKPAPEQAAAPSEPSVQELESLLNGA
jgi:hypothetical protein